MNLYKLSESILTEVALVPFKLEKEIQTLFENNLELLTGLILVKSEFIIKNKRIDTLAFNPETKAFVIIEYKLKRDTSVVDQGFTYLNLMLDYKSEFILEYNENLVRNLKRDEVNWAMTRVMFVSTFFTENQKQATSFQDMAIELWEIKKFSSGTFIVDTIKRSAFAPSLKPIAENYSELEKIVTEIKIFTEIDMLQRGSDLTNELYQHFKDSLFILYPEFEFHPKQEYLAFKSGKRNIADISIQKKVLKIWINLKKGMLDDPKGITKDVSATGKAGNGDYQIEVTDDSNLEYIMSLVRQALYPV